MYEVYGTIRSRVEIDKSDVIKILEQELCNLIGGTDRYISDDGFIYEDFKLHTWNSNKIREATEKEIKLYRSFKDLINYFQFKIKY